ncbi:MAG: hypothetical protein A3A94_01085 [Candidatus Portnoybacteria bacterium RIFCSPLOWO2_01_FULL_43_11]|uniref:Group 1 glycosyl transferase n=3 Tax=Bacteria candidate phyla TaxID=1783234 RepID=A0A1G2FI87_9BACT|nr:MAG: hypothetical protein A2713_00630 [candidate division WWE3 bacterium RIFCSPHIGHO2_01_FULL_35_17]OGZ37775.1 MAG: hypothetical protein A3E90_01045 [Candidatus Portnoybacteria bacterium RIFCSPHIGHO2_12_FULL_40_11]OGZ37832.1 MAG: hypothetical protein A3A94_01085 [Candidatus Portnoybacteria bacterium RIFCSPLOWO2_01_FULL_43_11]
MKILQINKFFFLKGGTERYLFDLSELLERKGHQVLVWSTEHPQNFNWPEKTNFVNFYEYSKKEGGWKDFKKIIRIFWNFEAKKKLKKLIQKEKPDLAHLHNIFHHFSPSIIFTLKKHHLPIVMTLHDYKFFCPNYKFFSQGKICFDCLKKENYWPVVFKKCVKNSYLKSSVCALEGKWQKSFLKLSKKIDAFIAPSLFIRKQALEWGIPKEKIFHLPNFVKRDKKENLSRDNTKSEKYPYLLYFGRLNQEKGIDILIKAFLKLLKKQPNWQLKIIGQGPEKEKLEKLAGPAGQKIEFFGQKQGNQLKELITRSYLTILPSLWPENFPYAVLESFIRQKTVISTRVGGIIELIKDKKTGLLVEPNNEIDLRKKIEWAIKHPQQINKMGQEAQKKVLVNYNSKKHYQELIKIYERIKNN